MNIKMIYTYSYGSYEWMQNAVDMCRTDSDFRYGCNPKEVVEFFHDKADKWIERLATDGCVDVGIDKSDINEDLTVYNTMFFVNGNYKGYICLAISR